jgi:hypothetical protein
MAAHVAPEVIIERFPLGEQVHGRVVSHLLPFRRVGVFVELDGGVIGFVDGEHMRQRPPVGLVSTFEVYRHNVRRRNQYCQVQLFPLEPRFRNERNTFAFSAEAWPAIKSSYHVGQTVTGTVTATSWDNRFFFVHFGDAWGMVTWTAGMPAVGIGGAYVITMILDTTRRIVLRPAERPPAGRSTAAAGRTG